MLVWPNELPSRLSRDGASLPFRDGRLRTETSTGPGRLRLRSSAVIRPVSGYLNMSAAEHARLERFWEQDTQMGILPFWFPNATRHGFPLISGADKEALLTADGRMLLISAWWPCQFGQTPPTPQPIAGGRMNVALSLSVLP